MKLFDKRKFTNIAAVLFLFFIVFLFFYKTFFFGKIPFPGDLLLSDYGPWRHESYAGYNPGAVPSKGQYFDVIRQIYPWKTLAIDQLKAKEIPLWNPYNFSGSPLLANLQSQVLYPLNLVYFIFPQITAWKILIILQPVLGLLFMYLYTRVIGLSKSASVISALLFNFSHFAIVWIEYNTIMHAILWLPLLLFLTEKGIRHGKLSTLEQCMFVIGTVSPITAGHPQDLTNMLSFFIFYLVFRVASLTKWTVQQKVMFLVYPYITLIIVSIMLAAPQILPTIELFFASSRSAHDYGFIINSILVQWWQLPLLYSQDLLGNPATKTLMTNSYIDKSLSVGTIGFLLTITAAAYAPRSWFKKFFIIISIILVALTLNSPITQLLYKYPIPIVSTTTITRILFLLAFSFSVLSGLGFDYLYQSKKFPINAFIYSLVFVIVIWVFVFIRPQVQGINYLSNSFSIMTRALILPSALFIIFYFILFISGYSKIILRFLVFFICIELFYSFNKFNPFVIDAFIFPKNTLMSYLKDNAGIYRSWGYGTARIEANFATQEKVYSADGYDPLNYEWYNQLLQSSKNGHIATIFDRTTRSDALIKPGYGVDELPTNPYRFRLLDALGVKYVLDRTENPKNQNTFSDTRFKLLWQYNDWIVYENLKSAPRFFLTSDVQTYNSLPDFESKFFSDNFYPERSILINEADGIKSSDFLSGKNSIHLDIYNPNRVEFTIHSETPEFLYLNDTFDSGWKAYINGQKTKIYKTNYAFRSIKVPEGVSKIHYLYVPDSFRTGVLLSLIAIVFAVSAVIIRFSHILVFSVLKKK